MKRKKDKRQRQGQGGDVTLDLTALFRTVPIPYLLSSLEATVEILRERGVEILDWDDKDKRLAQFRIIGNKAYFFAEKKEG